MRMVSISVTQVPRKRDSGEIVVGRNLKTLFAVFLKRHSEVDLVDL